MSAKAIDSPSRLSALVHRRSHELGLTLVEIADRAAIARSCLYKLLDGETHDPSIQTLHRLAEAIDVAPIALFRAFLIYGHRGVPQPCAAVRAIGNRTDAVLFCHDVTVPYNSIVLPAERFTKTWSVQNVGNEVWRRRQLTRVEDQYVVARRAPSGALTPVFDAYLMSLGNSIDVPDATPGETVELSVEFAAPRNCGSYASIWRFVDREGQSIYPSDFVLQVIVSVVGD